MVKQILNKLPVIRRIKDKVNARFELLEKENLFLATQNVNLRFKIKKIQQEKINVIFVCWRPNVWSSLASVYDAMVKDDSFNVKIVVIPTKKQLPKLGLNHEIYASEGGEKFWNNENVINGYNYETKEWFDLSSLHPDYVCFQQPYNIIKPESYNSKVVSKYAKLFYIHYASNFIGNGVMEETNPIDFINYVSLYFAQNSIDKVLLDNYKNKIGNNFTKIILTGFPRYDCLENFNEKTVCDKWNFKNHNKFRIIWTPRWCTNEGNCNFFDYKDVLLDYCIAHDDIDFIFRPHPQAFENWNATGELLEKDAKKYINLYNEYENVSIDFSKDYFSTFFTSDCLITDTSSIISDYFLTEKPIIYCHKKDCFNDFSRKMAEGFYWVENWKELQETINMLKEGKDPLKEIRHELKETLFFIPKEGSGNRIKECIKEDFYNA